MPKNLPFEQEIIVPLSEWKSLPNDQRIINAWNERLELMEKHQSILTGQEEVVPTKLPYRAIPSAKDFICVDSLYYSMLLQEKKSPIFTKFGPPTSAAGRGREEVVSVT